MNNEKKNFDPTVCFTFFGSWVESIEKVEANLGVEAAYQLYKAIADYSMYDEEPRFTDYPILMAIWVTIEREIDNSIGNRRRGFAGDEINEKYQSIINAVIHSPSASLRSIAGMTGTTKNMVDRVKKKYKDRIDKAIANTSDNNTDGDTDTYSVDDSGSGNDSMGQDSGTIGEIASENDISSAERESVILDRIRDRIIDNNIVSLEILANDPSQADHVISVREKWKCLYREWLRSITSKAADDILNMYLSTNTETKELKRLGDKYGRIINGWNEESREPNIVYSVTGYFPFGVRHNITGIPLDYYVTSDTLNEVEEEKDLLRYWMEDDELPPFTDDDMPF